MNTNNTTKLDWIDREYNRIVNLKRFIAQINKSGK